MPRFASALTPAGQLVMVGSDDSLVPWRDELLGLIRTYGMSPDWRHVDLVAELEARDLFRLSGREVLVGPEFVQPVNDWVESPPFSRAPRSGTARAGCHARVRRCGTGARGS